MPRKLKVETVPWRLRCGEAGMRLLRGYGAGTHVIAAETLSAEGDLWEWF